MSQISNAETTRLTVLHHVNGLSSEMLSHLCTADLLTETCCQLLIPAMLSKTLLAAPTLELYALGNQSKILLFYHQLNLMDSASGMSQQELLLQLIHALFTTMGKTAIK